MSSAVTSERLVLKGGRVLDPERRLDQQTDVVLARGPQGWVVERLGSAGEVAGAKVISLDGAWVCPGFVDLHSVVRDQADVDAALAGGFTVVVTTPDTKPARTDRLTILQAAPLTRALEGAELGEVPPDAPCLSQGFKPLVRGGVLRRALQYTQRKLLMLHAEDPSLTGAGVLGESLAATRLGLPAVPVAAETTVIARDLEILAETGGRLHFAHLTTARGVELVRAGKARGLAISCDVTPHHLTRDTSAAEHYSLDARVWPPLRSPADVAALKAGLSDGTIDAVACDHVRVDVLDREHAFEACAPGCEAFGHALPVALNLELTPARLVEVLASAPARLLGLPGGVVAGQAARLTVVDPRARQVRGVVVGAHHTFGGLT
ncbi:MAG: hypothetical protein U0228_11840 [Myxococcaceae bacterium]